MLEEKIIILSEEEARKHHFVPEKGKCYPPAHTGGGLIMPYAPSEFERKHCAHAPKDFDCSKVKKGPLGGKSHTMVCSECPYHPANAVYR